MPAATWGTASLPAGALNAWPKPGVLFHWSDEMCEDMGLAVLTSLFLLLGITTAGN